MKKINWHHPDFPLFHITIDRYMFQSDLGGKGYIYMKEKSQLT